MAAASSVSPDCSPGRIGCGSAVTASHHSKRKSSCARVRSPTWTSHSVPRRSPRSSSRQRRTATGSSQVALGPKGQPLTHVIGDLLEKEYVGKQPRRETLLSCSGSERSTMIQLNEALPERLYENADAIYYVLGGEGAIMMNGKETRLGLNAFVSVPRGTSHSFSRRGNRLLVSAVRAQRRALRTGALTCARRALSASNAKPTKSGA